MAKTTTKAKPEGGELFNAPPQTAEQAATGKAVATRQPRPTAKVPAKAPEPAAPTNVIAIWEIIERIAASPNANPDALDKLLSMQERIMDRQAKLAFNEAFVVMAPQLPMITKDGRIVVKEKTASGRRDGETTQDTPYARWEAISPVIVPVLSKHGFSIRHETANAPDGKIRITSILYGHGHEERSYMDFELDSTGSKNNAQARHSAITYGRRITACAQINIVTKGEDDDAKASGGAMVLGDPLTEEELEKLIEFAAAAQCGQPALLSHLNKSRPKPHPEIKTLADLPRSRFDEATAAISNYEANRKAREAEPSNKSTQK